MGDNPVTNLGVVNDQAATGWLAQSYCNEYPLLCGTTLGTEVPDLSLFGLDPQRYPGLYNDTFVLDDLDSIRTIAPLTDKDEQAWLGLVYDRSKPSLMDFFPTERPYQSFEAGPFFKIGENGYIGFTAGVEQTFIPNSDHFDSSFGPSFGVTFGWKSSRD